MKKITYIARILLSSFGQRLILIWIITLLVSFGLSMSVGIVQSQLNTQSYYLNDDMRDLAFLVDSATSYYSDAHGRGESTRRVRAQLSNWPGIAAIYEQTTVEVEKELWTCIGYPSELLTRLHLPTSETNVDMRPNGMQNPVWLDHRLLGQYTVGDVLSLDIYTYEGQTESVKMTVAGFLNAENVHYDFQMGSSAETYSMDFITRNPDYLVCITISDDVFKSSSFDYAKSCAKFLLPEDIAFIGSWKELARQQGVGYISSMDDILQNDEKNIDLMSTPILVLCIIMIVLTLIGLIGTQLQLMNRYKQIAFSLIMSGMEWKTWKISWLTISCLPLLIASLLGTSFGNAWKTIVMLENLRFLTPLTLTISLMIILLSVIGIVPTISRWSRIDINEFRRMSE